MAVYDYLAVDQAGRRFKGNLEADGLKGARLNLRSQGLFPLEVRPAAETTALELGRLGLGRVPVREVAGVLRQLTILIEAGLPLVDALTAVAEQAGKTRLGRILGRVKEDVVSGRSLAEAISAHPRAFPDLAVNMVRAGEAAGALEVVLDRLAGLLENRVKLAGRIRATLAYPVFMLVVGGLILSFLLIYIVPTITAIFQQTGHVLPLPTRILLAASHGATEYYWLALIVIGLIVLGWVRLKKSRSGRRFIDGLKLKTPIIGPVYRRLTLVRFSRTMATLLVSGVNLVDSLTISAGVVDNEVYRQSLEAAREKIEHGGSLAGQLTASALFPPTFSHLVAAGERGAALENVFERLAAGLETEVESALAGLLSLLEPLMILIVGLVVGFIVISILLPIFEMSRLVG